MSSKPNSPSSLNSPLDFGTFDQPIQFHTIEQVLASTASVTSHALMPTKSEFESPLNRTSSSASTSNFATAASSPSTSASRSPSTTPTVIDRSISTHYVKTLTELLQSPKFRRLELRAKFEYTPVVDGVQAFVAVCTVYEQATQETVFTTPVRNGESWPNKKRAKEEAAKLAVDWVELEENLGAKVAVAREAERREKEEREKAAEAAKKAGIAVSSEGGINWVGELAEWAQKRAFLPVYTTYALPPLPPQPKNGTPSFSCTVELPLTMLQDYLPTLTTAPVLGNATLPFSSKKTAKTAAAKAAMDWIVAQGLKSATTEKRASEPGIKTDNPHPLAGKAITISRSWKARKVVAEIVKELKCAVEYEVVPVQGGAVAIYTATAIVTRRWGGEGSVKARGSKDGVLGKDNAKEEVAQKVAKWFGKVELKRLGVGFRMIDEE